MAERISHEGLIGIVTVLFGSHDVVEGFFASLALQNDVVFRLYVIDNSPTKSTLCLCQVLATRYGIHAEYLYNNQNVGVAHGNNQGIRLAIRDGCTAVLLANNDTEFSTGTLKSLKEEWLNGAQVVTPKLLYYGPENLIWFAGGNFNPWTMRTHHRGIREIDRGQYNMFEYIGYAPTCFLLVDVNVFEHVGWMDDAYFVYYDDTDFVWRLRMKGYNIVYAPRSVVLHKVSTSTGGGESKFTSYYSIRNRIYFARKNLHGFQRLVALIYVLLTRIPAAMKLPPVSACRMLKGLIDGFRQPLLKPSL